MKKLFSAIATYIVPVLCFAISVWLIVLAVRQWETEPDTELLASGACFAALSVAMFIKRLINSGIISAKARPAVSAVTGIAMILIAAGVFWMLGFRVSADAVIPLLIALYGIRYIVRAFRTQEVSPDEE